MDALTARAVIAEGPVESGLTAILARDEIEKALAADEPPELLVDLTSFTPEGKAVETRSVAISWQHDDLERLLQQAGGADRVQLTFDRTALESAMDDVDAHGLREKALVLAVAATAAAGFASGAAASPAESVVFDNSPGVAQVAVSPDDRAVGFATGHPEITPGPDDRGVAFSPAPEIAPDDRAVPFATAHPDLTPSPDDRAVPFSAPAPVVGLSPDDRGMPLTSVPDPGLSPDDRAVPFSAPAPEVGLSPDDRGLPVSPAPNVGLSPDDRAVPVGTSAPAPVAPIADSDGWTLEAPSPEAIAIGGAALLAITGAAFAFAGRRRIGPGHT